MYTYIKYFFSYNNYLFSFQKDLGFNVKINRQVYSKISRKTYEKFLRDIATALFTEQEFATSSISGKKGKNVEAKRKVDENRLNAIIGT